MSSCPVTGNPNKCQCVHRIASITGHHDTVVQKLRDDIRVALRKVLSEHVVYTNWLIVESLPALNPDKASIDTVTTRLLRNADDIATLVRPLAGEEVAEHIRVAFSTHLQLAAATLGPARTNDSKTLMDAIDKFIQQGDEVAVALQRLSPRRLSLIAMQQEVHTHNLLVVELVKFRSARNLEYVALYDYYVEHMLRLADILYLAIRPMQM